MTIQEIANRLIELCRKGEFETVYKELYSPEIRSIEQEGAEWPEAKGFDGLKAKGEKWNASIETFHGQEIGEPVFADNHFAMPWTTEITMKGAPEPMKFTELCIYEVKDGKIVKEQFFYDTAN